MATVKKLVDQVLLGLDGFNILQPTITPLLNSITAYDTTIVVADTSRLHVNGVAQIGNELVYVTGITTGQTNDAFTVIRGWRSTLAEAHSAGEAVEKSPAFPRVAVLDAINRAVTGVYPQLFAVKQTQFTASAVQNTYDLPDDCGGVLEVRMETITPTREWYRLNRYREDKGLGKLVLYDGITPGQPITVFYRARPDEVTMSSLFTDTGLADTAEAYVRYAAAADLVSFKDVGRLPSMAAETGEIENPISGGKIAQALTARALMELGREQRRLRDQFKTPIRKTGRAWLS